MKILIQLPCFNEEQTLARTLASLPRALPGVKEVRWLVVDDGSTDRTTEVALAAGVDHLVALPDHVGLAGAFRAGVRECLRLGADLIVNTDGDNQYRGADIERLVEPILARRADLVIGSRPFENFPPVKRALQVVGSRLVSRLSGTCTPDVRSGFRAMSRRLASRLDVRGTYTYTLETLIQAGREGFKVESVPVRTNAETRPSRLIQNLPMDLIRSGAAIAEACRRFPELSPSA